VRRSSAHTDALTFSKLELTSKTWWELRAWRSSSLGPWFVTVLKYIYCRERMLCSLRVSLCRYRASVVVEHRWAAPLIRQKVTHTLPPLRRLLDPSFSFGGFFFNFIILYSAVLGHDRQFWRCYSCARVVTRITSDKLWLIVRFYSIEHWIRRWRVPTSALPPASTNSRRGTVWQDSTLRGPLDA